VRAQKRSSERRSIFIRILAEEKLGL
jgi:hypothetical protein